MVTGKVKILTVPHSGTRYVHRLLTGSQLSVSGPTDPYPDRDGQVLHWYAMDENDPNPKLGVLREPLAVLVSHTNTVPTSRLPSEEVWQQRSRDIRRCWQMMLDNFFETPFVRVEELTGPETGDARVLKYMLGAFLGRDVDLTFGPLDKSESPMTPLKEAYQRRDALAVLGRLPPEALALLRSMPKDIVRLYGSMYDIDWWRDAVSV